ncbi:hypothetical protein [Jeotgalibacillus salarius]|uniref:LysM domain-containing protein n=1 Tax=Jeotgalibacillus salarius TaxID=546023 RepID=A0A4Y8LF92_9BACL|nr:hypothetical protein [Jeotgalibacillus salarius]TFE01003.1 hypothetical protein E2626_10070 [Jeotgalibacillus salarius]
MAKNTIYKLQEHITFKGENALSELRSLSFEPSVSITEHSDQVVVEGTLLLAGEGDFEPSDEPRDSKYAEVQAATIKEDILYFEHHFPLSISIASGRVPRKQDVEVYIDHVDYEIPENGILQVTADIMIEGISEPEPEPEPEIEEVYEDSRVLPNPLEEWTGLMVEEEPQKDEEQSVYNEEEAVSEENVIEEPDRTPEDETVEPESDEDQQNDGDDNVEPRADGEEGSSEKNNEEDTFTRFIKSLDEERTVIKIHIAQQDETPETVAERYGVPMLQLMKVNQFESRRPFDRGELIRIPDRQTHSK